MFKRILIPMDGSTRAEKAIPVAARLARASGGKILLAQVATIPVMYESYGVSSYIGEMVNTEVQCEEEYLKTIKESEKLAGIQVETSVLVGSPAQTLLSMASMFKADLIVMTSQGKTGVKRWMLGSVAQKVARHSPIPVLVLHETGAINDTMARARHFGGRAIDALGGFGAGAAKAAFMERQDHAKKKERERPDIEKFDSFKWRETQEDAQRKT